MVVGVLGSPPTLDPYAANATDLTYVLARPLYPSLFRFSPEGRPERDLAASLDRGARRAEVVLERHAWSNGRAITAADVVASARRARPPSGFAAYRVRALDRDRVEFRGPVATIEQRLATLSFVLPNGRAGGATGGPFAPGRYTPGLEIVYRRGAGEVPLLRRVTVRFFADLETLLVLLERGRVDVASPPSTVNLDQRLDALGVSRSEALGWESVYLDLNGAPGPDVRCGIARSIEVQVLQDGFIRADGRLSTTLHPGPTGADGPWDSLGCRGRRGGSVQIAAPIGDELLVLIQRVLQRQLVADDFDPELVQTEHETFYGEWAPSHLFDVAVIRAAGAPGLLDPPDALETMSAFPVAQVETVVAYDPRVRGIVVNPTFEGPLWNAEEWWLEPAGS